MKSIAITTYPFLALTLFAQAPAAPGNMPAPPPSFNFTVRPFLEKNCQSLTTLLNDFVNSQIKK